MVKDTISVCRDFYEEYGAAMIRRTAPGYESRIAVGLAGEGSECFGFDDEISRDHDFGIGFCMWLKEKDCREIGGKLQNAYRELITGSGSACAEAAWGPSVSVYTPRIDGRRGVIEIGSFYGSVLQMQQSIYDLQTKHYWMYADECFLAAVTNGAVFRDDEGTFSRIREDILGYYPPKMYLMKLVEQLHLFSATGQSNYPRMMARNDTLTASICIEKAAEAAMRVAFMLNRVYAPYYKWLREGTKRLKHLAEIVPVLEKLLNLPVQSAVWEDVAYSSMKINTRDEAVLCIEEVAWMIVTEMDRQGLTIARGPFIENYLPELAARVKEET